MKINFSWKENRKSLIGLIIGLSILAAVRIFDLSIIDGGIVGAILGVGIYYLLDKVLPASNK
jgi:hypothetical protein